MKFIAAVLIASILLLGCVQGPGGAQATEKPIGEIVKEDVASPTPKATVTPIPSATPTPAASANAQRAEMYAQMESQCKDLAAQNAQEGACCQQSLDTIKKTKAPVPQAPEGEILSRCPDGMEEKTESCGAGSLVYCVATAPSPTPQTTLTPSTTTVPIVAMQEFTVEIDDSGWYPASITVKKGVPVKLTMKMRNENVYFAGGDLKSNVFNELGVKAGETRVREFTPESTFKVSNYWPSQGVFKGDLTINVE